MRHVVAEVDIAEAEVQIHPHTGKQVEVVVLTQLQHRQVTLF